MEVSFNVAFVRRVLFKEARWYDYIFCILLFGGFSIFGTYTGIKLEGGAISSIRDLGPMVGGPDRRAHCRCRFRAGGRYPPLPAGRYYGRVVFSWLLSWQG